MHTLKCPKIWPYPVNTTRFLWPVGGRIKGVPLYLHFERMRLQVLSVVICVMRPVGDFTQSLRYGLFWLKRIKSLLFLDTLTSLPNLNSTHTSEKRVMQFENNTWVGHSVLQNIQTTRLELLDLIRQHEDFPSFSQAAPSRSAYFLGTHMILYLSWDWSHQQTVRSLCNSLLLWFGRFIVTTDKTRAEMSLQNIVWVCHLSTDAAVTYGYVS